MACSEESFQIDSVVEFEDSLGFSGCYEAAAETFNDEAMYFLDGNQFIGNPGMYSSSSFDDDGDEHGVWVLGYYTTDGEFFRRCKDAFEEDSSTLHPADVLQWDCKDRDDTDSEMYPDLDAAVTVTCGCDSPTPAPTSTAAPTLGQTAPSSPSPEMVTEASSGETTPVSAIAGGVVAGVLVVGVVILGVLFKTGRVKTCRGGSRNMPTDKAVAPASASGSVPTRGTRVEATAGPIARPYPVAFQYPAAV
ncbi:unnamed protein product [Ectocarpus fasciculatus]